jgi:hypothetical protein
MFSMAANSGITIANRYVLCQHFEFLGSNSKSLRVTWRGWVERTGVHTVRGRTPAHSLRRQA